MGDQATGEVPPISLQSKDHGDLLNIIDNLRSQGISRYIDLPQLIVCGDQSSGKSSVLEAVSGIRFPTKDNLCTRFATELILRRGPATSASVTIVPNAERSESEKARLLKFQHKILGLEQFENLVNDAKIAMGLDGDAKAFSNDILRVEVSGPNQPHLTLVDLPGLFSAGNKAQSDTDAEIVKSLVLSYMEKSRSIILAVVSAKNDFANQIVTKYARQLDPEGLRTLGIITKPDTLHVGSDSERAFVELAENKDVHFRLGWHVLKNRDYDTRNCSAKERDDMEREFFSRGIWTSLPSNRVGISSLKPRLSSLLKEQILAELPSLIEDVTMGVEDCKDILSRLGESRVTLQEQRLHLVRVSQEFSSLTKAAVDGVDVDEFFGSAMDDLGYSKRLRAVIQNTCLEFAKAMERRGHAKHIVDDSMKFFITTPDDPPKIRRSDYVKEVLELMKRSRGRELPGTYNPLIIGNLFYEQSKNWAQLLDHYTDVMLNATRTTLDAILEHTADTTTSEGLRRFIINPQMDALEHKLREVVARILKPHQRGHPITYNHYFTGNVQKAKAQHRREWLTKQLATFFGAQGKFDGTKLHQITHSFDLKALLDNLDHTQSAQEDMDLYACSEAVDCMQAYYKVAMKTVVDNFPVLAFEECLLRSLPDLLSPNSVSALDDETISDIAAETEESRVERSRATEKLKVLERTLVVLRSLDRHKPTEPKKQLSSHHREPEGRGNGQKDSHKDMGRKIQKEEDSLPEGDIKVAEEYIVPPAPLVSAFGGPAAERAVESLAAPALLQAAQSPFAQPLSAVDFSWSSPSSKNNPSGYPPPHPRKK